MNINSLAVSFGFVCIFHVIGGGAIGFGIRNIRQGVINAGTIFMIVWGIMFGIFPLVVGFSNFVALGLPVLFVFEALVVIGAIAIPIFISSADLDIFHSVNIQRILIGGILLGVVLFTVLTNLKRDNLPGLAMGALFGVAGIGLMVVGVKGLFKS